MRKRIPTLALVAAMAAATFVALPPAANAQHHGHGFGHGFGHGYGHGIGHGFGHGFGGSAFYGPEPYRSNYGSVRISKEFRADARVYVDGAHVGVVDDFDGIFQRLRLSPGTYEVEIEQDGDRTFRQQIFVSRRRTYKVRLGIEPNAAAELTSGTEASSRARRPGYAAESVDSGAIRIQVKPAEDEAQVYVDGAHAGVVDDFDGIFQRLNLPTGRHDVEIRLAGHRAFRQQVFISPRRTYKLRHQLEPVTGQMAAKEFQPSES